jgi:hypothetical protein
MPVKQFNALSPIIQHLMQMVVAAFFVGMVYMAVTKDIEALQVWAGEAKANTATVTTTMNAIAVQQAVIKTKLEAEQRRSQDFRASTTKILDRILSKLTK